MDPTIISFIRYAVWYDSHIRRRQETMKRREKVKIGSRTETSELLSSARDTLPWELQCLYWGSFLSELNDSWLPCLRMPFYWNTFPSQSCMVPGLLSPRMSFYWGTFSLQSCVVPWLLIPKTPSYSSRKANKYNTIMHHIITFKSMMGHISVPILYLN